MRKRCSFFDCSREPTVYWICTGTAASYHCDAHVPATTARGLRCCRVERIIAPVVGDEVSIALECAFRVLAGDDATRRSA